MSTDVAFFQSSYSPTYSKKGTLMPEKLSLGREEAEMHIKRKAMWSKEFRKLLILDPKGTIEDEFGQTLPGNVKIIIHEESPTEIHIVIPSMDHHELDESGNIRVRDLESMQGAAARTSSQICTIGGCTCSQPPPTYRC